MINLNLKYRALSMYWFGTTGFIAAVIALIVFSFFSPASLPLILIVTLAGIVIGMFLGFSYGYRIYIHRNHKKHTKNALLIGLFGGIVASFLFTSVLLVILFNLAHSSCISSTEIACRGGSSMLLAAYVDAFLAFGWYFIIVGLLSSYLLDRIIQLKLHRKK